MAKKATPRKRPAQPKTAKRPGRPKGAKTQQLPIVKHLPTACPGCGSSQVKVVTKIRDMAHTGQVDGFAYNHVIWRRMRCVCGQIFLQRQYAAKH